MASPWARPTSTSWRSSSCTRLLKDLLAGRADVYVAADMFLYYERGNPRASKAPDVMVIFGVGNHKRRTFKTWVEHAVPTVIFEISSDETYEEDLHGKREVYQRLGVAEYFLFDPLGDCLDPRLQGFRLEDGQYVALTPEPDGGLISVQLGVRLVPEGDMLRLIDLRTGQPLLTSQEKSERLRSRPTACRSRRIACGSRPKRRSANANGPMRSRPRWPACGRCSARRIRPTDRRAPAHAPRRGSRRGRRAGGNRRWPGPGPRRGCSGAGGRPGA